METFKGNSIRKYLHELRRTEREEYKLLQQYREMKLKKLLLHAIESVPAYIDYQELKEMIEEKPLEALTQFPILTKSRFQKHKDHYLATTADKATLFSNQTGGSTGQPVTFYLDRYTVEHYEAARWRGLSWHGINIGDPSVMIWGSPIEISQIANKKNQLKELYLKNRIVISAFQLNEKNIADYIMKINKFKPAYLYGYASALHLFAKLMKQSQHKLKHKLVGVVSTAETLQAHYRAEIEAVFQCPVINEYGARDGGILAYECTKGNMHIQAENVWLEIVDLKTQQPVKAGQRGKLIVTDLNNFSMPRIRYEIGDIGTMSSEPCSCGLTLPVLSKIEGREDDIFIAKDGAYVHGQYFTHIIRVMEGINQYQIIQHDRDNLTIKLVLKPNSASDYAIHELVRKVKNKMGNIQVHIEKVNDIPCSPSGKVRSTIRNFPLNEKHTTSREKHERVFPI